MRPLVAFISVLLLSACAGPLARGPASAPVEIGIIAINDFHGNLEPPQGASLATGSPAATVGGAATLAAAIDWIRASQPYSVTVSAGDLISASPLVSSLYLDEPTIGAMDRIGLEFNAVGNHEFDRGQAELLRMQNGGCEQHTLREPCRVERFEGANFRFLSASTYSEDGKTLFPATGIKRFETPAGPVSIGFVGLTLRDTYRLVSPQGIAGLTFGDEADAINRAVPTLRAQGADAIAVLIHEGGAQAGGSDPNACDGLEGPIMGIVDRLAPEVDLVVSGHTHRAYVCDLPRENSDRPLLLTSAGSYGRLVTRITLTVDPRGDRVIATKARNIVVQSRPAPVDPGDIPATDDDPVFSPRSDIAAYIATYADAARDFALRPVGKVSSAAARREDGSGGPLGNLVADAQLAATRSAGAQIAFTNPGGLRAPLQPSADGLVTFAQLYAVQPFGNQLVTQTLSGSAIRSLLEQGIDEDGPRQLLSPSAGFTYTVDPARPSGSRIVAIRLNGVPLNPQASYRVTTNAFLAYGGDGFTALTERHDAVVGVTDIEALEQWVAAASVLVVPEDQRVTDRPR
ncbi:MAG: bifunctional metallophosphatase/5'-nucleotidase [Novosphingobium sp.]|nr:bifunctional metallophosphatase/5'-nucleotidase [Novosphingobium sp.]